MTMIKFQILALVLLAQYVAARPTAYGDENEYDEDPAEEYGYEEVYENPYLSKRTFAKKLEGPDMGIYSKVPHTREGWLEMCKTEYSTKKSCDKLLIKTARNKCMDKYEQAMKARMNLGVYMAFDAACPLEIVNQFGPVKVALKQPIKTRPAGVVRRQAPIPAGSGPRRSAASNGLEPLSASDGEAIMGELAELKGMVTLLMHHMNVNTNPASIGNSQVSRRSVHEEIRSAY